MLGAHRGSNNSSLALPIWRETSCSFVSRGGPQRKYLTATMAYSSFVSIFVGFLLHCGDIAYSFSFNPMSSPRVLSFRYKQEQPTPLQQLNLSMPDDPAPSDYDSDDLGTEKRVSVDTDEDDAAIRDELKRELILLASISNRGACASTEENNLVVDLVTQLEALNPTADPALNSQGDWDLCYSSTQSFRSSPFFLAIRAFLGDDNKAVAENAFAIHDR